MNLVAAQEPQLKIEAMIDPLAHAAGVALLQLTIEQEWAYWRDELQKGDLSTRHYALYGIGRYYPDVALQMLPDWARAGQLSSLMRDLGDPGDGRDAPAGGDQRVAGVGQRIRRGDGVGPVRAQGHRLPGKPAHRARLEQRGGVQALAGDAALTRRRMALWARWRLQPPVRGGNLVFAFARSAF